METREKIFFAIIASTSIGTIASYPLLLDEITLHVFDAIHTSSEMVHNSYTFAVKHSSFHNIFHMNNLEYDMPHFLSNAIIL